ncbi:MAG: hypothetical protein P8047_17420 [Gammaproteobacteria bacterium]
MSANTRIDEAMMNPAAVFAHPSDVIEMNSISREQKLLILKRWEQDARELAVAEEEGMTGNGGNRLSEIIKLIDKLDPDFHQSQSSPDKHGNINA